MKKLIAFLALLLWWTGCAFALTFAVVTDSQGIRGEPVAPLYRTIIKEISLLSPDFMMHIGDWTSKPSRDAWTTFLAQTRESGVPFHLAIGNHGVTKRWDKWHSLHREIIKTPLYYSFTNENCLFIVLCCYTEENGQTVESKIDAAQFQWLENELKKATDASFVFVFVHEPLYPSGPHMGSSLDRYPGDRQRLAEVLKRQAGKTYVFCGHEHRYQKRVFDGLTQIIVGAAGAPSYITPPEEGGFPQYLYVTVKNRKLTMAVVKPGNITGVD